MIASHRNWTCKVHMTFSHLGSFKIEFSLALLAFRKGDGHQNRPGKKNLSTFHK